MNQFTKMFSYSRTQTLKLCSLIGLSMFLAACDQSTQSQSTETKEKPEESLVTASPTTDTKFVDAVAKAASEIDEKEYMAHINTLASDEYEGRAPSTPGGEKTVVYLESHFRNLGLEPAFIDENGLPTFRQPVSLMELTVTNSPPLVFKHEDGTQDQLPYKENSIVFTSRTSNVSSIENSNLVFVGYGIVAPEYGWDDYAGIDMTGKTAVILVNDPGYRKPAGELFKGLAMTYYGRWTYKFEEAARQGASGAIIVHEYGAAGYPWQVVSGSWSGPQYKLYSEDKSQKNVAVEGWISQDAAVSLFAKSDLNYTEMVAKATEPGFKPIAMKSTASASMQMSAKQSMSNNVAGVIRGRERPDEGFIYTAHWDHLGVKEDTFGKDKIFNGAQDNATGTAGILEIAQAFKALPQAPERSVIFLAVTAEESGLLGSKQYAERPAFPMKKTVAGINIDGMSTIGASNDMVVVGYGNSEMDNYLRDVAKTQNRTVVPEPTPEKGYFYRSDHFNLAKKGVPMLYAEAGLDIKDQPSGFGEKESNRYLAQRYHKPGDEVHAEWSNGGIMQDLYAHFIIGEKIANSDDWPQWTDGNEFKAIREASLAN